MSEQHTHDPRRADLRITRGHPDDADIAALTAALTALTTTTVDTEPPPSMSLWADPTTQLRHPAGQRPLHPGPHTWRASALPL